MPAIAETLRLTHEGALQALNAAVARADAISSPMAIVVCDASGVTLASVRMDGCSFLSLESATNKAASAASKGAQTGSAPDELAIKLGVATSGRMTLGLKGGAPIYVRGICVGAIGVGSGSGEQDLDVAIAGIAAIEGAETKS